MQKTVITFVFLLASVAIFAQNTTVDSTKTTKTEEEITLPCFGVYDDLDEMKQRFKAYKQNQKKEKELADIPQDEHLWEAAKGPQDFQKKRMISAYSVKKPKGYASDIKDEQVDKESIGNAIKSSLILSKGKSTTTDNSWQLKLKKD